MRQFCIFKNARRKLTRIPAHRHCGAVKIGDLLLQAIPNQLLRLISKLITTGPEGIGPGKIAPFLLKVTP
jgi:hypothetical protein